MKQSKSEKLAMAVARELKRYWPHARDAQGEPLFAQWNTRKLGSHFEACIARAMKPLRKHYPEPGRAKKGKR